MASSFMLSVSFKQLYLGMNINGYENSNILELNVDENALIVQRADVSLLWTMLASCSIFNSAQKKQTHKQTKQKTVISKWNFGGTNGYFIGLDLTV